MQKRNIFIFLYKNELSIYSYGHGEYKLQLYKGSPAVTLRRDDQDWKQFWDYARKEFVSNETWDNITLSLLYHETHIATCLELIEYPCKNGLNHLHLQSLESALPELLCKMDILKQQSSLVGFSDTFWSVTPYSAHIVSSDNSPSAYKLRQDEIIKAYLGSFPVQGERYTDPATSAGNSNNPLYKFIDESKVTPKKAMHEDNNE